MVRRLVGGDDQDGPRRQHRRVRDREPYRGARPPGGGWKEEGKTLNYGEVRKVEELNGIDTLKAEAPQEMMEAAIKALGEDASADNVALLTRALRRGKIIAETNPRGRWRKKVFVRQRDKDHDVNQVWMVTARVARRPRVL